MAFMTQNTAIRAQLFCQEVAKNRKNSYLKIGHRAERGPDDIMEDFLLTAHRFGLEAITAIALNSRLGCFTPAMPSEVKRYLEAIEILVKLFPDLLMSFPWWNYFPKRWSSVYRVSEDNFHIVADFVKGKIDAAVRASAGRLKSDASPDSLSVLVDIL
jgi:hypothetical protein